MQFTNVLQPATPEHDAEVLPGVVWDPGKGSAIATFGPDDRLEIDDPSVAAKLVERGYRRLDSDAPAPAKFAPEDPADQNDETEEKPAARRGRPRKS